MEEQKKELIVSSDYYSSSYIVNSVYLVTLKRYADENSLMIIDTTGADEQITTSLLAAIYRNLSRPDTDALLITNYSQKAQRVTLLEIDTVNLLENNELILKIDNQQFNVTQNNKENEEQKKKKKKSDLLPDQPRRNPSITEDSEFYPSTCKPAFKEDFIRCYTCKHQHVDMCDFYNTEHKNIDSKDCPHYEMSASNNTERRQ